MVSFIHIYLYAACIIEELCFFVIHYCSTGWRKLIGSPKLQIIFHKRATKYRSLLWKMTYKEMDPMSLRHPVRQEFTQLEVTQSHVIVISSDFMKRTNLYITYHLYLIYVP